MFVKSHSRREMAGIIVGDLQTPPEDCLKTVKV